MMHSVEKMERENTSPSLGGITGEADRKEIQDIFLHVTQH